MHSIPLSLTLCCQQIGPALLFLSRRAASPGAVLTPLFDLKNVTFSALIYVAQWPHEAPRPPPPPVCLQQSGWSACGLKLNSPWVLPGPAWLCLLGFIWRVYSTTDCPVSHIDSVRMQFVITFKRNIDVF